MTQAIILLEEFLGTPKFISELSSRQGQQHGQANCPASIQLHTSKNRQNKSFMV
jgi:hypothetical protein